MQRRNKIIYWITTVWLALGMVSTGLVQILKVEEEIQKTVGELGYPEYFLTILGIWKILGSVIVLIPKLPVLKEWAYAGFFFAMSGAIVSHIAIKDPFSESLPAFLLLTLTILSWYFRPSSRKIESLNSLNNGQ